MLIAYVRHPHLRRQVHEIWHSNWLEICYDPFREHNFAEILIPNQRCTFNSISQIKISVCIIGLSCRPNVACHKKSSISQNMAPTLTK